MPLHLYKALKTSASKKTTRWLIRGLVLLVILWPVGVLTGRLLLHVTVAQIIKLTNSKVTFESIDYNFDGSISLEKLEISPYQRLSDDDAILRAGTVYARFGVGSLLMLRPRLRELSLKDFTFNAQHDADTGRWNFGTLKFRPPRGRPGKIPRVHLEKGTLQYSEVSGGRIKRTAALPVSAGFRFDEKTPEGYKFVITLAHEPDFDKSPLTGFVRPGQIVLGGAVPTISMPDFGRTWQVDALDVEFNYDRRWNYLLKLEARDLRGTFTQASDSAALEDLSALQSSGPFGALLRFFDRYRPAGQFDIELRTSGSLRKLGETTLSGKVYCKDISICHRSFPYRVEHLTGEVDLTERSAVLNNLRAYHNDVLLFFNGFTRDFDPDRKYDVRITSNNMALDNDLYQALNERHKKFWSLFSPTGRAAIDYRLSRYPPGDKDRRLTARLLGASAAYSNFPYPLKNLTGTLLFEYDTVTASDLVSEANDCKITINGKATACRTDRPISDFYVRAENVPLDSTLASALPAAQQPLYDSLSMAGSADADIKIFTPRQDLSPTTFVADVSFKKTSLKTPFLGFAEQTEASLTSPTKEQLPLSFSDVSAQAVFTPDLIRIEDFTGRCKFGPAWVTGQIRPGDQPQHTQYDLVLHTDKVQINDDMIDMLPASMSKIASELRPDGSVNLGVAVSKAPTEQRTEYKVTVDFLDNTVDSRKLPYPLKDITGSLTITEDTVFLDDIVATPADGNHVIPSAPAIKIDGQVMFAPTASETGQCKVSNGDIAFMAESLKIKRTSLTNLSAAVCYDPNRNNWVAKKLLADYYGGRLAGKLELIPAAGDAYEYLLQTGFENVDLKQFLADIRPKESSNADHTTGRMSGSFNVAGRTRESLPRMGRCNLEITDMQVGKLSPLAKLLYVLNLTGPKDFAFERMLVDAYINNNRVFIKSFDLSGDAIAFCGSGSLDMQNWIVDLTLTARGRRLATAEPSVLQSLPDALGGAIVRMEVTGNVYDPHVETTALPVIADSLNILGTKPTEEK